MKLTERFEEVKRFVDMNQAHQFDTIVSVLEVVINTEKSSDNFSNLSALLSLINDMLDRDKLTLCSRAGTTVLTKSFVEKVIDVLLQYIIEDKEDLESYRLNEFIMSTGSQYRLYMFYVSSINSISESNDTTQLVDVLMKCIELIKYMRLDNFFLSR